MSHKEEQPPILKTPLFWAVFIGLAVILTGGWAIYARLTPNETAAPLAGHSAPDFALPTLAGETLRLSDLAGQPVLINFWATWCPPCKAEMPDFQEVYEADGDLVIIGVNHTTTDEVEKVEAFVAELEITFPIVLDESGQVVEKYHIRGLPTSILVDRNGIIQEVFTGPINKAYIESKLSGL